MFLGSLFQAKVTGPRFVLSRLPDRHSHCYTTRGKGLHSFVTEKYLTLLSSEGIDTGRVVLVYNGITTVGQGVFPPEGK